MSHMLLDHDLLVVVTSDAGVQGLDAYTGEQRWSVECEPDNGSGWCETEASNILYWGQTKTTSLSIDKATGAVSSAGRPPPGALRGFPTSVEISEYSVDNGLESFKVTRGSEIVYNMALDPAYDEGPVLTDGGWAWSALSDGRLCALDFTSSSLREDMDRLFLTRCVAPAPNLGVAPKASARTPIAGGGSSLGPDTVERYYELLNELVRHLNELDEARYRKFLLRTCRDLARLYPAAAPQSEPLRRRTIDVLTRYVLEDDVAEQALQLEADWQAYIETNGLGNSTSVMWALLRLSGTIQETAGTGTPRGSVLALDGWLRGVLNFLQLDSERLAYVSDDPTGIALSYLQGIEDELGFGSEFSALLARLVSEQSSK